MADGRVYASSEFVSVEQREFSSEQDIPDPTTYVSSLKTDELKAELIKRGLKRSGHKSVLIDRLRAAIQSQDQGEEPIERSSSNADMDKLIFQDFILLLKLIKVKEVCRFEIENLKSEASASYTNELVISLQNENKDLQDKLQKLESHHTILKQEANSLRAGIQIQEPRAKPFLISNWYRPPNSPIELFHKFEVLLAKIEAENVESNILGDINCDMMAVTPANETRHLIELCELFQYTQLIKEPTRVTSSTKSLIHLFLTNEPVKFATSGVFSYWLQRS